MENKNLLYIVGGIAVIGIGYYLYKNRKSATPQQAPVSTNVKETDATLTDETEPKATSIEKPKNPMASETGTTTPASKPASKPKIQLTKNEVEYMLLKKCGNKPLFNTKGKIEKYENCKNSFKSDLRGQGLISFNGQNSMYSNMTNDFDVSFR